MGVDERWANRQKHHREHTESWCRCKEGCVSGSVGLRWKLRRQTTSVLNKLLLFHFIKLRPSNWFEHLFTASVESFPWHRTCLPSLSWYKANQSSNSDVTPTVTRSVSVTHVFNSISTRTATDYWKLTTLMFFFNSTPNTIPISNTFNYFSNRL